MSLCGGLWKRLVVGCCSDAGIRAQACIGQAFSGSPVLGIQSISSSTRFRLSLRLPNAAETALFPLFGSSWRTNSGWSAGCTPGSFM
ncbi:hypothetical protein AOLI_G00252470 [Acnodon oligacanthus]